MNKLYYRTKPTVNNRVDVAIYEMIDGELKFWFALEHQKKNGIPKAIQSFLDSIEYGDIDFDIIKL